MKRRYVYAVLVQDGTGWKLVRCFQTLRAAQHRAAELSQRPEFKGRCLAVERSLPVVFDGNVVCEYRDGVVEWPREVSS